MVHFANVAGFISESQVKVIFHSFVVRVQKRLGKRGKTLWKRSTVAHTLYKIFAAEFIGRDKGGSVESQTKIAIRIFKAWKNDPVSSRFPAFKFVKEWRDLMQWNKDNFLFMAKWYLSRQKASEAAKTSHNKRVSASRKKTRPA
jgi:hypothetical protein